MGLPQRHVLFSCAHNLRGASAVYLLNGKGGVLMIASAKHMQPAEVSEPIRCAVVVVKPSEAQKHKTEALRYFVLVIAVVAVFLLIAIALYYMQAKSVTIEHASSLASPLILRA
jgi:hypothetical protein